LLDKQRRLPGKPQDAATGLTSVGARWYDPASGMFQSLDPVFEATSPQQQNGYTYAGADPVSSSDPSGKLRESPDHLASHGGSE